MVSEAGTARFTIERVRAGRRARLRGAFRHGAVRGPNRLRFSGKLRARALAPGRYNLVIVVVDLDDERSRVRRARFRVVA